MRLELGEFDEVSFAWPLVNERGESETLVFDLWPEVDHEANARHIVKAVNYHERLVEALRQCRAQIRALCSDGDVPEQACTILQELEGEL